MAPRKQRAPALDLQARGAHVLSVFGAFQARALVEMPAELAAELFPGGLVSAGRTAVIDAVERDAQALSNRAEGDAGSLAASAIALAYELAHPFNSATSKSMCARELRETMDRLRELAPTQPKRDEVDEINEARERRRREVRSAAPAA